jgi:hypothetical protein
MTLNYLLPALWGLVLLASFIGYGVLVRRLLFSHEHFGWAQEAAWGMAFVVVLGGLLNSLSVISRPLILALVAIGFALALADVATQRKSVRERLSSVRLDMRQQPVVFTLKMLAYGCIIVLACMRYLSSVDVLSYAALSDHDDISGYYSLMDDVKGYFAFPKQMLELGAIATDPFSGMRLVNGLGGMAILHVLMLVPFDVRNLILIDGSVAFIICLGLVLRIGEDRSLAFPWKIALALFFLSVPYYPFLRINSSSFSTGMVMFLALFAFLGRDAIQDDKPVRNAVVTSMIAASACALKSNHIPPVVLILVLSYLWYVISTRLKKEAVIEALLLPVFVFLMLLPWMISLQRTSGTMLYPLLGMGYDEYNYGNYLSEDFAGGRTLLQKLTIVYRGFFLYDIYPLFLLGGMVTFVVVQMKHRAAPRAIALGSFLAMNVLLLKFDISNIEPFKRYLFVFVFPSLIFILTVIMEELSRRVAMKQPKTIRQYGAAVFADRVAAIALMTILGTGVAYYWYDQYAGKALTMYSTIIAQISGDMIARSDPLPESKRRRYRQAQKSVPAGEAIISRDDTTLLYNYGRNHIYNINDPGTCSPPPGMPYFEGPETVAAYLLSKKIRYVAYAYSNQAGYPVIDNLWRLRPDRPYMHRIGERAKVALDRVLGELGASRKRIYDDGELFILDLETPAASPAVYREPNYFQIGKILVLAWARTQGFDRNKVWTDGHGTIEDIRYQREAGDDVLVLNTFGYHPWKGDMKRLNLVLSVNGSPLPFIGQVENAYVFSLGSVREPIMSITIDSSTFVPRREGIWFGKDDDQKTLGIDVDTIQISN